MRGDEPSLDDDDEFDEEFGEDDLGSLLPESQELNGSEESGSEDSPLEEYDGREIVARMNHDLFEDDEDETEELGKSNDNNNVIKLISHF